MGFRERTIPSLDTKGEVVSVKGGGKGLLKKWILTEGQRATIGPRRSPRPRRSSSGIQ